MSPPAGEASKQPAFNIRSEEVVTKMQVGNSNGKSRVCHGNKSHRLGLCRSVRVHSLPAYHQEIQGSGEESQVLRQVLDLARENGSAGAVERYFAEAAPEDGSRGVKCLRPTVYRGRRSGGASSKCRWYGCSLHVIGIALPYRTPLNWVCLL